MKSTEKTIGNILSENNLELPGIDTGKTAIFMILSLILLFLVTDNSIFQCEIKELEFYQGVSTLLLILCMSLSYFSGILVKNIIDCEVIDLSRFFSLFYGKILINFSVFLFFSTVCIWVVLLGGIMTSPFATLLSISPILLTIQFIYDYKIDRKAIYNCINSEWKKEQDGKNLSGEVFTRNTIYLTSLLPVVLVTLVLTIGQYCVDSKNIPDLLLENKLTEILKTEWYSRIYYFTYFFSVFVAAFGVLPKNIIKKITKKIIKKFI